MITRPASAQELITEVLDEYNEADGVKRWEEENRKASTEVSEHVDHLMKMRTFLDAKGWLGGGHKLAASAEIHRSKTLPTGPEIDI